MRRNLTHSMSALLRGVSVGVLLVVACSSEQPPKHPVTARAPFDLNCENQLKYYRLSSETWGVAGCGRQATYIRVCRQKVEPLTYLIHDECTWQMNSAASR